MRANHFLVAAVVLVLSAPAWAVDTMSAYGVSNYTSAGMCCNDGSCSNLTYSDDQARAFDDVFDGWQTTGYWDESFENINAQVDPADWIDGARQPTYGNDDAIGGVDYADVGYFAGHGGSGSNCSADYPKSHITMGEEHPGQECRPASDNSTNTGEWFWGNDNLKIVVLDACQSMQKCVWDVGGYSNVDGVNLRTILGFHGDSFDTQGQVEALRDYASNSRTNGVGANWLDFRVVWNPFPDLDQCPTVVVWGSSTSLTEDFFNNGGLDDWINTGQHTMSQYFYLANCDPNHGVKL